MPAFFYNQTEVESFLIINMIASFKNHCAFDIVSVSEI